MDSYPPLVVGDRSPKHWAAVSCGHLTQHIARPATGVWLKAAIDLDTRVLAWVRALTNMTQIILPERTEYPSMWLHGRPVRQLQRQLDLTLDVFREHLDPDSEDTTMYDRRQMMLDTMLQICRSLTVGLSWTEAAKVLEDYLHRRQRSPARFYRAVLTTVHERLAALEKEKSPSTQR